MNITGADDRSRSPSRSRSARRAGSRRRSAALAFGVALGLGGWLGLGAPVVQAQDGAGPGAALALGAKVPASAANVKMKSVDGRMLSIADATGKAGTLVVFTCNHCPFAKGWEQRIAELGNGYSKRGVGVVLVNANDPAAYVEDGYAEMQARARKLALEIPYVVDATSEVARAFGASVTPESFLFDKSGKLVYHGAVDDNHKEPAKVQKRFLEEALDAVVSGKSPATSQSKSIGCGIKFRKT